MGFHKVLDLGLAAGCIGLIGLNTAGQTDPLLRGDYDGSAVIDTGDIDFIIQSVGGTVSREDLDLNRDGTIDAADVELLLQRFGIEMQDVTELDADTVVVHDPVSRIANDDGELILPLLAETESARVLWQSPEAGTTLGVGDTTVQYMLNTPDGLELHIQSLRLKDKAPPSLEIATDPVGGTWTQRPQRVPYIVSPASVSIDAFAVDSVDGLVEVTCELDGSFVELPMEVTSPGFHWAILTATDAAGNIVQATRMFEIRTRKIVEPAVTIQSLKYRPGPDGRTIADLYLAIDTTSPDFSWNDVHPLAFSLFGTDEHGAFVSDGAPVRGVSAVPVPGTNTITMAVDNQLWDVLQTTSTWSARFELLLDPGVTTIDGVFLSGRSQSDATEPFDLQTEAAVGLSLLQQAGDGNPVQRPNPVGPTPWIVPSPHGPTFGWIVIEWKSERRHWAPDTWATGNGCSVLDPFAADCGWFIHFMQHASAEAQDRVGQPHGMAQAVDEGCYGSASASCSAGASGQIDFWLDPQWAGDHCEITTRAFPRFRLLVSTNDPALALAGAQISVSGGGISATAAGAYSIGSTIPPVSISFPSVSIPITLAPSGPPIDLVIDAGIPQSNTINAKKMSIQIGSNMHVRAFADAVADPGYSFALISDPRTGLSLEGVVVTGYATGCTGGAGYP